MAEKKAWSGRFKESNDPVFERMNRSLDFDINLYKEDIALNKAYSAQLNKLGVISDEELIQIHNGLDEIRNEIEQQGLSLFDASTEDIHMGVEARLASKIGDAAKRIHTGKSRNDQVATDVRLYLQRQVGEIIGLIKGLMTQLLRLANEHNKAVMPGFTHLRQAQPVMFAHYMMSFFFPLSRDVERLQDALKRISIMPLGSAALAGSAMALDREFLRDKLGFAAVSDNSMDGVLSRDFAAEFLADIAILGVTLSRMSEDFILYSSEAYKFFDLSDKVTTGSSIMPNKKNPDSLELTRGKSGRFIGNLMTLLTVLKSQPSTYNKDMQEDKEPLFDTVRNIKDVLEVDTILLETMTINEDKMRNAIDSLSFATELADYLAGQGLPFREAHGVVGRIVRDCVDNNTKLTDLHSAELSQYHQLFAEIPDDWGSIERFLAKRNLPGGTGPDSVACQLKKAEKILKK
ncbi:MAG: argininosuccinate lyase [Spirochaetales bacterium]|nr:argininosuccinate lyase [Spirochaetales bacterium]